MADETRGSYLSPQQITALLAAIKPHRVGKDGKGFSHVEAYELRAHLNRILGFARWSEDVVEQECLFEHESAKDGKARWTVCYRSVVRLTVCAPDGTALATYTEGATGEAANQPSRADSHDLSLKSSQSQAFKRCCANLGDQFGLSLYNGGSLEPLVKVTLVASPDRRSDADTQDAAPRPRPEPEPYVPSPPPPPATPPAGEGEPAPKKPKHTDAEYRDLLLAAETKPDIRTLMRDIALDQRNDAEVGDETGEPVTLFGLADRRLKAIR